MDELSMIFSSPPATEVFYISSIVFVLAYLAAFLLLHGRSRAPRRRAFVRHGIPALGAALIAAGVGTGLQWASVKGAPGHPALTASVSPEQIHRSVDAKALPLREVREPF